MAKKAKQSKKSKTPKLSTPHIEVIRAFKRADDRATKARTVAEKQEAKASSVAKKLKGKYKTRSEAYTALKPTFAKVYTGSKTTKLNGKAKGKAKTAVNKLDYVCSLLFKRKSKDGTPKKTGTRAETLDFVSGMTLAKLLIVQSVVNAAIKAAKKSK